MLVFSDHNNEGCERLPMDFTFSTARWEKTKTTTTLAFSSRFVLTICSQDPPCVFEGRELKEDERKNRTYLWRGLARAREPATEEYYIERGND